MKMKQKVWFSGNEVTSQFRIKEPIYCCAEGQSAIWNLEAGWSISKQPNNILNSYQVIVIHNLDTFNKIL